MSETLYEKQNERDHTGRLKSQIESFYFGKCVLDHIGYFRRISRSANTAIPCEAGISIAVRLSTREV